MIDQEVSQEATDEQSQAGEGADGAEAPQQPSQLSLLKSRADLLGITYSNNIGIDALRAKINAKVAADEPAEEPEEPAEEEVEQVEEEQPAAQADPAEVTSLNPLAGEKASDKPVTAKMSERQKLIREATKLVRCRIANLDPKKANLPGEIFTVGNGQVGTIKKFIPYGEATDGGYHIPQILFDNLKERKFQHIRVLKDRQTGRERVETSWQKEFAIDVLDPLTPEELHELKMAQLSANNA